MDRSTALLVVNYGGFYSNKGQPQENKRGYSAKWKYMRCIEHITTCDASRKIALVVASEADGDGPFWMMRVGVALKQEGREIGAFCG